MGGARPKAGTVLEPGLRVTGQRLWTGQVKCQCDRPGVTPGLTRFL